MIKTYYVEIFDNGKNGFHRKRGFKTYEEAERWAQRMCSIYNCFYAHSNDLQDND